MFVKNELDLLCDALKKSHVSVVLTHLYDPVRAVQGKSPVSVFGARFPYDAPLSTALGEVKPVTVYKLLDPLRFSYIYFKVCDKDESILFIGPYTHGSLSPRQLLEMAELCGIEPRLQKSFERYCASVPILPESSHLFVLLDAFLERLWDGAPFLTIDVSREHLGPASPIHETASSDELFDDMAAMEERYRYENELMEAVSLGQTYKFNTFAAALGEHIFEKRVSDPLRNMKNYSIIMNTLLRKAAEKGGVHPMYIDRVSSAFAVQIEGSTSLSENASIMRDMFESYCRLVRKHSMKSFSPVVRKAIIRIDSDLSVDLSLSVLAKEQGISAGYLSTVFKKETDKTVTEYIWEKRIKHAAHLLSTTHLQIQTVALHCGIVDVQYFSKMFKKYTGKTPKEYRETVK